MLHKTIKDGIIEALRAKDTIKLEVLRGLNALCINEIIATGVNTEFLPDEKVLALIKRSAKQRKDSIEQFDKGGRKDLSDKERAELVILNSFLPTLMTKEDVKSIVSQKIESMKSAGALDAKQIGKITGIIMKELNGKAEGSDVKAVIEELLK